MAYNTSTLVEKGVAGGYRNIDVCPSIRTALAEGKTDFVLNLRSLVLRNVSADQSVSPLATSENVTLKKEGNLSW